MHRCRSLLFFFASSTLISALTGCGNGGGPDPGTTKAENVPGYDFPVEDEYKNMEKLKSAVPES